MMIMNRDELFEAGIVSARRFCEANDLPLPPVTRLPRARWKFDPCAYYRPRTGIVVCLEKCSPPGRGGAAWSWPGYAVDRTPHGVVLHELGHYVDYARGTKKGAYWSDYSGEMRAASGEPPLTSYCPDDAEWFAEIFRLFAANPDLLRHVRPRTHTLLLKNFRSAEIGTWREILTWWGAPERTMHAAERRVAAAARGQTSHTVPVAGPPKPQCVLDA